MERTSSGGDFQSVSPTVSFSNWLPSFYDELLLYLEQEWKWSMIAFPEDYKILVPRLLKTKALAKGQFETKGSNKSCLCRASGTKKRNITMLKGIFFPQL
ncbi:hypothetical protein P8452_22693 [Trifolium repens]|nr:hypothetical protein P8452_22693 [Trifolium repens]